MSKISSELIELCEKEYCDNPLIVPLGKIDDNERVYLDFTKVSGLFIAGATGTGKSVSIDFLIHSLMYKNKSTDIKFYLIDPKEIELNEYNGLDYVVGGKSEYDIIHIKKMLDGIQKEIEKRMALIEKVNITTIDKLNDKLPHIFVVIDEGYDIYNDESSKKILVSILNAGRRVGIHLIFATNSYLKEYAEDGFIDRFKYRMTFDLASLEQAKYINIKNSSWLSGNGEAFIKGVNSTIYKFQVSYVDDNEIKEIVLHSKK